MQEKRFFVKYLSKQFLPNYNKIAVTAPLQADLSSPTFAIQIVSFWDWVVCELWSCELRVAVANCKLRVRNLEIKIFLILVKIRY